MSEVKEQIIRWPFGEASALNLGATGAQALTVENTVTIVDGVSTEATGNRTINLEIDSDLEAGARIVFKLKANGVEQTIFGAGITGATIIGVAGKTKTVEAVYDGNAFVVVGAAAQID